MSFYDPRPIPDPRQPINRATLDNLRQFAIPGGSIAQFANLQDWIAQTGVGPRDEGATGKRWRDNDAINTQSGSGGGPKENWQRYYTVPDVDEAGAPQELDINDQRPHEGMSHITWAILGPSVSRFVLETKQSHGTIRPELAKVPKLKIISLDGPEAARMNFSASPPGHYPLCDFIEDETGGVEYDGKRLMTRWPASYLPRFSADGWIEIVEIYHYPSTAVSTSKPATATVASTARTPQSRTSVFAGPQGSTTSGGSAQPTQIHQATALDGIQEIDGMGYDTATGEAIRYINWPEPRGREEQPTGWTFLTIVQLQPLPVPGTPLGTFTQLVGAPPWGFATLETAHKLVDMFRNVGQRDMSIGDWKIDIVMGDKNEAFPFSSEQRYIAFTSGQMVERHNAGLIAAEIARNLADPEVFIREKIAAVRSAFDRMQQS